MAYVVQLEELHMWARTQMVDPFEAHSAFDAQLAMPLHATDGLSVEERELRHALGVGRA